MHRPESGPVWPVHSFFRTLIFSDRKNECTGQSLAQSGLCTHFFGPRNSSCKPAGRASLIFTTYRVNHGVPRYGSTQCTAVHVSHRMAESKPCSYSLTVRCGTCIAHRWKPCGFRIPLMYGTNSTDENCSRRSLRAANIQYMYCQYHYDTYVAFIVIGANGSMRGEKVTSLARWPPNPSRCWALTMEDY